MLLRNPTIAQSEKKWVPLSKKKGQKYECKTSSAANRLGVRRKANVSKIQSSAPALDSDIKRYANIQHESKTKRNQNIANAFYQGGHTQTAIALALDVSGSTVSRVIKEFENGG